MVDSTPPKDPEDPVETGSERIPPEDPVEDVGAKQEAADLDLDEAPDAQAEDEEEDLSPEKSTPRTGPVKVPEAVYAELVRRTAGAIPGVSSVIYRSGPTRLWRRRGIRVRSAWGGRLVVDVSLKLKHGVSIPHVAQLVQDEVAAEIEAASGKRVKFVRVRIVDVLPPDRRRRS